jgi:hypothetical protein
VPQLDNYVTAIRLHRKHKRCHRTRVHTVMVKHVTRQHSYISRLNFHFHLGVVTNTRAVWETARGICSALSEQRSHSDRASGRERVNINQCTQNRGSGELRDYVIHAKLSA